MAACGIGNNDDDSEDCVQVVRESKIVKVPCTRNTYKEYTVKVPRQVTEQVPRTVQYTDYESRQKQIPYTVNRPERRIRMETQKYQVPVTKYYKRTTMQTRERQVPVSYYVKIPETKYHTVTEQVPVQRTKVEMVDVMKTVYDFETRTRCVPVTKIVTKQIPVYNVLAKPPPPCPSNVECGVGVHTDLNRGDVQLYDNEGNLDVATANKYGQLSQEGLDRDTGNRSNAAGFGKASHASNSAGFGQASHASNAVGLGKASHASNAAGFGQASHASNAAGFGQASHESLRR